MTQCSGYRSRPCQWLQYAGHEMASLRRSRNGFNMAVSDNSSGEYARDEDGDGFHEVHVNTMEGFWSLLLDVQVFVVDNLGVFQ